MRNRKTNMDFIWKMPTFFNDSINNYSDPWVLNILSDQWSSSRVMKYWLYIRFNNFQSNPFETFCSVPICTPLCWAFVDASKIKESKGWIFSFAPQVHFFKKILQDLVWLVFRELTQSVNGPTDSLWGFSKRIHFEKILSLLCSSLIKSEY